jgi:hypothetical protein
MLHAWATPTLLARADEVMEQAAHRKLALPSGPRSPLCSTELRKVSSWPKDIGSHLQT